MLNSLLRQLDRSGIACDVLDLGVAKDDATAIRDAVVRGFAGADVVLVSGGMSMGTRDLVPQVLEELGVQIHIRKVRIKPGKPFIFGTLEGTTCAEYVLGLPGNPVRRLCLLQGISGTAAANLAGARFRGAAGPGRLRPRVTG